MQSKGIKIMIATCLALGIAVIAFMVAIMIKSNIDYENRYTNNTPSNYNAGSNSSTSSGTGSSSNAGTSSDKAKDSNGRDKTWAQVAAQDAVKSQLKSPSSAKFSWLPTITLKNDIWTVSGTVESQNSFGAMVKSSYIVQVQSVYGNEYKYTIVSCQIS